MPKIKIICTEQERNEFMKNACPSLFNPDWKHYFDCAKPRDPLENCSSCLAQYVDWEITDETV